ncbi:SAM-dependent methyltransferase [Umezawaea sp.]|uniref:SAM-dependent methyltransferase n=1 Tax=Umezawaea sp. TaxID=1955258 RepID=UPI002ED02127
MQERPKRVSAGGGVERPNLARLFDYYLGGAHNFAVDREFAERSIKFFAADDAARTTRSFLRRAVHLCATAGIRQFLDLGSGIPTAGNVHEVVERVDPSCRVVYVDNDAATVAHGRTMLRTSTTAAVVHADVRDPDAVLNAPETARLLDLDEPVAVVMVGILPYLSDDDRPADVVAKYREAVVPGSRLVVSHLTADLEPEMMGKLVHLGTLAGTTLTPRGEAAVAELFTGFDVLAPGVVPAGTWHQDGEDTSPSSCLSYGAVGVRLP